MNTTNEPAISFDFYAYVFWDQTEDGPQNFGMFVMCKRLHPVLATALYHYGNHGTQLAQNGHIPERPNGWSIYGFDSEVTDVYEWDKWRQKWSVGRFVGGISDDGFDYFEATLEELEHSSSYTYEWKLRYDEEEGRRQSEAESDLFPKVTEDGFLVAHK